MSRNRPRWGWWALAALLGLAVLVDIVDGQPLKLATSLLLFVASLVTAAVSPPRQGWAAGLVLVCTAGALVLILYRAFGPGL